VKLIHFSQHFVEYFKKVLHKVVIIVPFVYALPNTIGFLGIDSSKPKVNVLEKQFKG
jgi:hypothetical protein